MDTLLRKLVEWKARQKAAQIIVFDGGAEVERMRAFLKGAVLGVILCTGVFLLTAPRDADTGLVEELGRREVLLRQSNVQLAQAVQVADVCIGTAQRMEQALDSYESYLGSRNAARARAIERTR